MADIVDGMIRVAEKAEDASANTIALPSRTRFAKFRPRRSPSQNSSRSKQPLRFSCFPYPVTAGGGLIGALVQQN